MINSATEKELLYLSALVGMDNCWGIEDPFSEYSKTEIMNTMRQLREDLLQKGCIHYNENDSLFLNENWKNLLTHCKDSKNIFVLESTKMEEAGTELRYFVDGETVIRYQLNDTAQFAYTTSSLMRTEILSFFGEARKNQSQASYDVSAATMRRMGSLSTQRFREELLDSHCEESLASLIMNGLQGNPEFQALLAYVREKGMELIKGRLVVLHPLEGSLLITSGKEYDSLSFRELNDTDLKEGLSQLLGQRNEVSVV